MKKILKYQLLLKEVQILNTHQYSKILTAQLQSDVIVLWVETLSDQDPLQVPIYIIGTGQPMPIGATNYIATIQQDGFVWHIYQ